MHIFLAYFYYVIKNDRLMVPSRLCIHLPYLSIPQLLNQVMYPHGTTSMSEQHTIGRKPISNANISAIWTSDVELKLVPLHVQFLNLEEICSFRCGRNFVELSLLVQHQIVYGMGPVSILPGAVVIMNGVCRSFPQSHYACAKEVIQLCHDHFLPTPFQFIIHQPLLLYSPI
jgi:hypothetical protein